MSGELSLHQLTPREPLARKVPSLSFQPGTRIGGYKLVSPLGTGGMGRVFLAEDEALDRKVALKTLPPEDADDEGRARFLREAQALARVHHKNVVQVFASGVDEDVAWMALEYVVGDPLGALLDGSAETGGLDEETALSLCAQAARGLAAVHAVGVVHRDVKPDNLLLDEEAVVRVLDFGVALFVEPGRGGFVTQKGVAVGTPHFMAPEQARGGVIDARADAWGLGATLYSLLTGRPPFYVKDDEADLDILARVLRERAPDVRDRKPGTSAATAQLLSRLLEPDVDQRLADMTAIAAVLDAVADGLAAGGEPPLPPALAVAAEDDDRRADGKASAPSAPVSSSPAPSPVPAPGPARGRSPASALALVAVALTFAALGAVVASGLGPAPAPAAPDVAPAMPAPVPVSVPVPAPAASPLTSPLPLETRGDPLAPRDVVDPAPPTAEALEAKVAEDPEARAPLRELVGRDDDAAVEAVKRLAAMPGQAGDAAVETIALLHARGHIEALEAAVRGPSRARALRAIDVLVAMRPFEALQIFDDVQRSHEDKAVRARAAAARRELFSVEP